MTIVGAIAVPHPPLIVPAVGRGDQARIQDTIDAYERATRWLLAQGPDCLVVTSPHAPLFRDAFHVTTDATLDGSMARFRAPHERIHATCDVELARAIVRDANAAGILCADSGHYRDDMDHGTYVPLYFVREETAQRRTSDPDAHADPLATSDGNDRAPSAAATDADDEEALSARSMAAERGEAPSAQAARANAGANGRGRGCSGAESKRAGAEAGDMLPCPIVRIGLSGLSPKTHRALGRIIAQAADTLGRRVGFIASGDLSHKLLAEGPYGFAPEGPAFDERIGEIFASGNLDELFAFDEAFCEAAAECGLRSFQIMAGALEGLAVSTRMLSNEGPFGVGYGVATCAVTAPEA